MVQSRYDVLIRLIHEEHRSSGKLMDRSRIKRTLAYRRSGQRALKIGELMRVIDDDHRHLEEYRTRKK